MPQTSVSSTPIGTVEPAQVPNPGFCGSEMPLFAAELDRPDPLNVDGSSGPGPNSAPAGSGQLVTHWRGEFANYELRWPPDDPVHDGWSLTVAALPATAPQAVANRARLVVQLDEQDEPCSQLSVEVYGLRADPLLDEIAMFADTLRLRSELPAYLDIVVSEQVQAAGGEERQPGRCTQPLQISDVDQFSYVTEAAAFDLVGRFMSDRLAGHRAHDCLTVSALNRYDEPSDPQLCLFVCDSGAEVVGPDPSALTSAGYADGTLVLAEVRLDRPPGTYREQLEVQTIEQPDGSRIALITEVVAFPESFVDPDQAQQLVEQFLDDLANERFEAAAELLVNEGYSQAVELALGDVYNDPVAPLLEDYCQDALCSNSYTIVRTTTPQLFAAAIEVRFDTQHGPVTAVLAVSSFEGHLSIGSLPPEAP